MAFWIIWLVTGVTVILCFAGFVIPKIMLKLHASTLTVRARAVERINKEIGDTVVYIPSATVRRYIKRYRVGHDEDGVYFCGELATKAAYAEYELTVYNVDNEVIEILRVKEKFNESAETEITRLPEQTDYVGVQLICIDDNPIPAERRRFGFKYAAWLCLLCGCLTAAVDLLLWLSLAFVLRCIDNFTMTLVLPAEVWAELLGYTSLGVVIITCCFALGRFFLCKRSDTDE